MTRRVCVVTGSRAEYGLLRGLLLRIRAEPGLALQLAVTGSHLAAEYGRTEQEIGADGFRIDRRVDTALDADTPRSLARTVGLGVTGFGEALAELRPDLLLVLGDRFEILAAVVAALFARVPVAHLYGGESSEGSYDDAIRHAITKMSHLHFVAAEPYRARVLQLGEDPARVFTVGGLGVDNIRATRLLPRAELESALGFRFGARNLLVTFHPATLDSDDPQAQLEELLAALEGVPDIHLVLTLPNADLGGQALARRMRAFAAARPNAAAFDSLGSVRYLSCLNEVDAVVGNSSSGLAEAPTFRKPAVNIGTRQDGRLRAASVIDCAPRREAIAAALERVYDPAFRAALAEVRNPYGEGGAAERIVRVLSGFPLDGLVRKRFHAIP